MYRTENAGARKRLQSHMSTAQRNSQSLRAQQNGVSRQLLFSLASPDGHRPTKSGRPSRTDLTSTPSAATHPRRQKHPTGGASAGSGHNPALRGPQSPGNFCATNPAIFPPKGNVDYTTENASWKCGHLLGTDCTRRSLYFVPKTSVERARNSSALPALIATYIDSLPYANRLTSGAMSAPARTSSKCGICKKVPESSISPRPSTEAVIPLIAATDSRLQKRFVYASFMDF